MMPFFLLAELLVLKIVRRRHGVALTSTKQLLTSALLMALAGSAFHGVVAAEDPSACTDVREERHETLTGDQPGHRLPRASTVGDQHRFGRPAAGHVRRPSRYGTEAGRGGDPPGPSDPDFRQSCGRIRTRLADLVGRFGQASGGCRTRVESGNPQTWWPRSLSIHLNRLSVRLCNEVRFFSDPVLEAAVIGSRQLGYSVNL